MNNNLEAGEFNIELKEEEPVWMDKKRYTIFALPISFTTYYLTPTKILIESGLFTTREDEIMLYRIRDISATQNIFEKLNKTGTIRICSSDVGTPELLIQHVKNHRKVKEAISQAVEKSRKENGIKTTEMLSPHHMLRTDYGEASVNTVLNATIDGKMMMGYSNPYTSATGLNFLLSALASGGNDNIVDTAAVENFQKFQANVPLVSFTTQQMVQSADKGVVDGLVMEYQSYQNDPTLQRNYEFIPFGVRHDNPLYSIGNISAEKKEVIAAFVSLCAQNQAEATKDGFNGLDDYAYTGKVYDGNTIAQAQSVWKEEKDSGIPIVAEFVVDTSGSMRGEPINALKTAMINTIQYINDDNYIGIIGFDSDVREYLPIDQFSLTQKTLYKGAVNSLDANGNTAMYNGLCVAMDRIYKKSQELGGNCTPIIFVLTDGDSNTGYKFSETKDIIAGMNIPIYTISYNYAADSLSELASINEAASIVGNSEDITYKLRNLFNAEM